MDYHQFQRPETPPPTYDAATNGEKYQKCGSCLLLGKCLGVNVVVVPDYGLVFVC